MYADETGVLCAVDGVIITSSLQSDEAVRTARGMLEFDETTIQVPRDLIGSLLHTTPSPYFIPYFLILILGPCSESDWEERALHSGHRRQIRSGASQD